MPIDLLVQLPQSDNDDVELGSNNSDNGLHQRNHLLPRTNGTRNLMHRQNQSLLPHLPLLQYSLPSICILVCSISILCMEYITKLYTNNNIVSNTGVILNSPICVSAYYNTAYNNPTQTSVQLLYVDHAIDSITKLNDNLGRVLNSLGNDTVPDTTPHHQLNSIPSTDPYTDVLNLRDIRSSNDIMQHMNGQQYHPLHPTGMHDVQQQSNDQYYPPMYNHDQYDLLHPHMYKQHQYDTSHNNINQQQTHNTHPQHVQYYEMMQRQQEAYLEHMQQLHAQHTQQYQSPHLPDTIQPQIISMHSTPSHIIHTTPMDDQYAVPSATHSYSHQQINTHTNIQPDQPHSHSVAPAAAEVKLSHQPITQSSNNNIQPPSVSYSTVSMNNVQPVSQSYPNKSPYSNTPQLLPWSLRLYCGWVGFAFHIIALVVISLHIILAFSTMYQLYSLLSIGHILLWSVSVFIFGLCSYAELLNVKRRLTQKKGR